MQVFKIETKSFISQRKGKYPRLSDLESKAQSRYSYKIKINIAKEEYGMI